MISLDTVEAEILDLEKRDTTYAVVERLAWLYVVRDHLAGTQTSVPETMQSAGDSEFLSAVDGAPLDGVLEILDEHFQVILALYPKEHDKLVGRILALKEA